MNETIRIVNVGPYVLEYRYTEDKAEVKVDLRSGSVVGGVGLVLMLKSLAHRHLHYYETVKQVDIKPTTRTVNAFKDEVNARDIFGRLYLFCKFRFFVKQQYTMYGERY